MQYISKEELIFIINPNSGKSEYQKILNQLTKHYKSFKYIITENLKDLNSFLDTNLNKYKILIVVGGDGTVNHILPYIYKNPNLILGIIPTGSGNGIAREFGFKDSLSDIIKSSLEGNYSEIDLLSINDIYCINVAGIGLGSKIAHVFSLSKRRGFLNYIISTIKTIFIFKPFDALIQINEEQFEGRFMMVSIANNRQLGNNAIISPKSNPSDEKFELVLVKRFPVYMYPILIINLFTGKIKTSKYIEIRSINDEVRIFSDFKYLHIDGEPKYFRNYISCKMLKRKIKILKTNNN